ncbi:MAG: sulfurtransferase-like selenium metabolism protein YedF [Desulfovibrio sp.]|nr:sulfurtransferase-like selenium metabolism protein YedF [Desulfovibrio sp.]
MPEIELNCQNLPCPQPVLRCKRCLAEQSPASLVVVVDNQAARENVSRFLSTQGYAVQVEDAGDGLWRLRGAKGDAQSSAPNPADDCEVCEVMTEEQLRRMGEKVVVFLTSDVIGSGDDALGAKLMQNFLATLPELGAELWRVVMLNGAVRLSAADSPALPHLKRLEAAGATVLVCGTCLDHFGLLEQKAVGQTTNMLDVVTSLQLATKIIRP